jgi:hypothetical protein
VEALAVNMPATEMFKTDKASRRYDDINEEFSDFKQFTISKYKS